MKRSVKNLSDTKVELTVLLEPTELEAARQVALTKLARRVKVPGFRQGKAPASVAARHIDPTALSQQTLEDALSKAVAEAFLAEKVQALERPEVDITAYEPSEKLEFTATAEILPSVTLGNYKDLDLTKPKTTVTAKEIDEVIERLRQSQGEKKPVERAAKKGDEVIIDFVGKKDDEPFKGGTAKEYPLRLGSGSFIPGFEEGIIGKKPGDSFDLDLKFPEDYQSAELKGAKVVFSIMLGSVHEVVLPEINDEFAAKAGPFKTMDELKKDVKAELQSRKESEATTKQKDEMVEKIIAASTVPVPEILLKDQVRSVEQDISQNLMYQGRSIEEYVASQGFASKEDWTKQEVEPIARQRVQAGLVLAEISKAEKITASTDEVDQQIAQLKQQYKNNANMVKQLDMSETRQDIASRLLTDKTVDHLLGINSK